ncbi:MAG: histidine phosphatase family protein [Planctomycetota bacterium]
MKLILIRHGETDYTAEKRYCGAAIDAPLNNKGIRQARQLRRQLSKHKIDAIYVSPMARTLQTADIALGRRRIKLIKDSLLRESHLGKWEGHTLEEIKVKFPKDVQKWYKDPLKYGATDGETPIILHKRVKRFLKRLLKNNNGVSPVRTDSRLRRDTSNGVKVIAIVTHSGPFRIIVGEMNGNGLNDFWELEPKTCEHKIIKV